MHLITRYKIKYTTVIVTVGALGSIPKTSEESLKKLTNEECIPIVIQRIQINKMNDPILNLTPENITQHSGIE